MCSKTFWIVIVVCAVVGLSGCVEDAGSEGDPTAQTDDTQGNTFDEVTETSGGGSSGTSGVTTITDDDAHSDAIGPDVYIPTPRDFCGNGQIDRLETDIDCGGPYCEPCAGGLRCEANLDCIEGVCAQNVCRCPLGQVADGQGACVPETSPCASAPCLNGGVCTSSNPDTFSCECPPDWSGDRCQTRDGGLCSTQNPCLNGALCADLIDGGVQCFCEGGFWGATCEAACELENCLVAATCDATTGDLIKCDGGCVAGFDGNDCTGDIDECISASLNNCAPGATCLNNVGGFTCVCPPGTVGDGRTCFAATDCQSGSAVCGASASCVPVSGGSVCVCDPGFTGDGVVCTETDGCASAPCFPNVVCNDLPPPSDGFSCGPCPAGFVGDGQFCNDIDGCAGAPCFPGVVCNDLPPPLTGFVCDACPAGFTGDGQFCNDIDECLSGSVTCSTGATCNNNPGGFSCDCPTGNTDNGVACVPAKITGARTDADPGRWDDGTLAASCLDYRYPPQPYLYTSGAGGDGVYRIDSAAGPLNVYCDMTTDGGGWTLAFIKNSVHNGIYNDFCSSDLFASGLAMSPADASLTTQPVLGWLNLNASTVPFDTLRLAAYHNGAPTFLSQDIPQENLRIPFGQDGYLLYNDPSGYSWCAGGSAFTDNGVGQIAQPPGAPADCKGHATLGSGWDFSDSATATNQGLTLCGSDGSAFMFAAPGVNPIAYENPGAAYAIWVRSTPPNPAYGTGRDGTLTLPPATSTLPATRASFNGASGALTITTINATGTFSVGSLVMLHQTRGLNAGQYELQRIASTTGAQITFTAPLQHLYLTNSSGAERAQVLAVPEYLTATIPLTSTLTAPAWDGFTGGILAFVSTTPLTIHGNVTADALGFVGIPRQTISSQPGDQGEGHTASPMLLTSANGNGGGGGGHSSCYIFSAGAGGGGGHANPGSPGNAPADGVCQVGGDGGLAVGSPDLTSALFFGGAGGQGGADEDGYGSGGANGGGIIYIAAPSITVSTTGAISSNGQNGDPELNFIGCGSGGGGGGAGGSILLLSDSADLGSNRVRAQGGSGGSNPANCGPSGGNGSPGRIATQGALTGSTTPPAFAIP